MTIREIETYYRDVYVPDRRAAGEEPAPMVQVLDRIESRIQAQKRDTAMAAWIGEPQDPRRRSSSTGPAWNSP